MVNRAGLARLDDKADLGAQLLVDQEMVDGGDEQQAGTGTPSALA